MDRDETLKDEKQPQPGNEDVSQLDIVPKSNGTPIFISQNSGALSQCCLPVAKAMHTYRLQVHHSSLFFCLHNLFALLFLVDAGLR